MARAGIRFDPPPFAPPPEVSWMLLRAFGPLEIAAPAVAPAAAFAMAQRFELAPRIAARQGARLAAELGEEAAAAFVRARRSAAASGLWMLELAGDVAAAAAPLAMPLVFLKFVALERAGVAVLGRRAACDVDVMAPPARAAELVDALRRRGYASSPLPAAEHQLPALTHPGGGIVEVHRLLLGVRPEGGASATVDSLERRGLLAPAPGLAGRCAVPTRATLAAHALVHGLGQHGWWPDSYSGLKMIGDLVDLCELEGEPARGSHAGSPLETAARALVAHDVTAAEAAAAFALAAALAAGRDALAPGPAERGEARLLRHILAGRLDPSYAAALRLGVLRRQPSDRPPALRLARTLLAAVWLSRPQIDAIYGPPRHPLGYLGRRLARPFDLLARLGRYGARSLALRRGRPRGRLYTPDR